MMTMATTPLALSNLMVCLALSLKEQHPSIFDEIGRASADEGEGVFVYDVLSSLTGKNFDACWDALERAGAAGLIEPDSTFQRAWLTADGVALADKSHLDLLDLCRRHADRLDPEEAQGLRVLIDAAPRPVSVVSTVSTVSSQPIETEDEFDADVGDDEDAEVVVAPRRARP